jgi:hypothetical protein
MEPVLSYVEVFSQMPGPGLDSNYVRNAKRAT